MRSKVLKILVLAAYLMALAAILGARSAQEVPVPPNVFSGKVFFRDSPAPDGVEIFLRVGEYQSNVARTGFTEDERPIVVTLNGEYSTLKAQPLGESFFAQQITFHATIGFGDVQAQETDVLIRALRIETGYDLHFPTLPPGKPTPTPPPTPTMTPTPTPTPVLPIPGDPSVSQLPRLALALGAIVVVVGAGALLLMRRRQTL